MKMSSEKIRESYPSSDRPERLVDVDPAYASGFIPGTQRQYLAAKGTGYARTVLLTLITMLPASIAAYVVSRVIRKTRSVTKRINGLMRQLR